MLQKFFWAAPPLLLAVTYSQPILAQTAEVKTSAPENMAGDGPKNAGVLQAPTDSRASYNVMLPSSKETNPSFEWINAPAEAPRVAPVLGPSMRAPASFGLLRLGSDAPSPLPSSAPSLLSAASL